MDSLIKGVKLTRDDERKNSPMISTPTNFRHIIHFGASQLDDEGISGFLNAFFGQNPSSHTSRSQRLEPQVASQTRNSPPEPNDQFCPVPYPRREETAKSMTPVPKERTTPPPPPPPPPRAARTFEKEGNDVERTAPPPPPPPPIKWTDEEPRGTVIPEQDVSWISASFRDRAMNGYQLALLTRRRNQAQHRDETDSIVKNMLTKHEDSNADVSKGHLKQESSTLQTSMRFIKNGSTSKQPRCRNPRPRSCAPALLGHEPEELRHSSVERGTGAEIIKRSSSVDSSNRKPSSCSKDVPQAESTDDIKVIQYMVSIEYLRNILESKGYVFDSLSLKDKKCAYIFVIEDLKHGNDPSFICRKIYLKPISHRFLNTQRPLLNRILNITATGILLSEISEDDEAVLYLTGISERDVNDARNRIRYLLKDNPDLIDKITIPCDHYFIRHILNDTVIFDIWQETGAMIYAEGETVQIIAHNREEMYSAKDRIDSLMTVNANN